jgi:hypothetical protein
MSGWAHAGKDSMPASTSVATTPMTTLRLFVETRTAEIGRKWLCITILHIEVDPKFPFQLPMAQHFISVLGAPTHY